MPDLDRLLGFLSGLPPRDIVIALGYVAAIMYVVYERRISLLALAVQYVLLALLLPDDPFRPIKFARMGLGVAVCAILYLSAGRVHGASTRQPDAESAEPVSGISSDGRSARLKSTGFVFRLLILALAALSVSGIWRMSPLGIVPAAIGPTFYGLTLVGLLMVITSLDPLRRGIGLLTLVSGFEAAYLFVESSLMAMALIGVMDILLAVCIAYLSDSWATFVSAGAAER